MQNDKHQREIGVAKQELARLSSVHKIEPDAELDPYIADGEGMPPECENMLPLHKHVCRSFAGAMKKTSIASLMGISFDYVTKILARDDSRAYIRYLSTQFDDQFLTLTENIQRAALRAFDAQLAILNNSLDDRLVAKVASDIMDRAGAKAPDRIVVTTNTVFTAADIRAMRDADDSLRDVLDG